MKHLGIAVLLSLFAQQSLSAQSTNDTIKILLIIDKNPLPGASCRVKGTSISTYTNGEGLATLVIPNDKDKIEISVLHPYAQVKIIRPVDSLYLDLDSRRASYYVKGKKMRTKKVRIAH